MSRVKYRLDGRLPPGEGACPAMRYRNRLSQMPYTHTGFAARNGGVTLEKIAYRHPNLLHFFKEDFFMSKSTATATRTQSARMATRTLSICALLCALNVVFARFMTIMPSAVARFSIEAVPVLLAGYFFGPVPGMLVGFAGDTVGCLFSGYGWNPIISITPMMVGAFAGILRPLIYKLDKPWDIWRVALTILPSKLLGSIYWTSQCLVWLGFSKKGLTTLMAARTVEAMLEFVLETVVVMLLLKTGLFRRMRLFPPAKSEDRSTNPMKLMAGLCVILQIAILAALDVTGLLPLTNGALEPAARLGLSLLTLLPIIASAVLAVLSNRGAK